MDESVDNLEGMNEAQLRDLIRRAEMTLRERGTKRIEELRQLAREAGYEVTLTKIGEPEGRRGKRKSGTAGRPDRRREVPAKYQNPDNPSEKWSGRDASQNGSRWLSPMIGKLEDLVMVPAISEDVLTVLVAFLCGSINRRDLLGRCCCWHRPRRHRLRPCSGADAGSVLRPYLAASALNLDRSKVAARGQPAALGSVL
jgi:DNA-binding protein H-NS